MAKPVTVGAVAKAARYRCYRSRARPEWWGRHLVDFSKPAAKAAVQKDREHTTWVGDIE